MKAKNLGILITDHNVRETLQLCDRAYVIAKGERIKEGTPAEIIGDAKVREVYLGNTFDTPTIGTRT
jgi:lipopolysaccharide export system ATP-binding protein